MSYSASQYDASKFQPKFKDCAYDNEKPTRDFRTWIKLLSGIVRNIRGGRQIELFLDFFLERNHQESSTRPSFLNNPALRLGPQDDSETRIPQQPSPSQNNSSVSNATDVSGEEGNESRNAGDPAYPDIGQGAGQAPGGLPPQYAFDQEPETIKEYHLLPEESKELDSILFQTLYTCLSGSFLDLISDLNGEYARYSFAIIALWKHVELTAANRRLQALNGMGELQYHGDAGKWKLDFIKKAREVYASKVSIEHFIMQAAFKSFDGKNQQVQATIATDINAPNTVRPGMNLEALATKYSTFRQLSAQGSLTER